MCVETSQSFLDFKSLGAFVAQSKVPLSRPEYILLEGTFTGTAPTDSTQVDTAAPEVLIFLPLMFSRLVTFDLQKIIYPGVA